MKKTNLHRACFVVVVLAGVFADAVQAQAEAPVGVHSVQQQQPNHQGRTQQQHQSEPVLPPTVHLRSPALHSPPAPHHYDDPAPLFNLKQLKQPQLPAHEPGAPGTARKQRVPLSAVVIMSAFMWLMSLLGVLPYFIFSKLSKPWAGLANAVASGVMLTASFGLLAEGAPYSGTYLIAGMMLGVMFVKLSQEHLEQYEVDSFEQLAGADARKVILFLAVMAVHAVGEGGGVGVSFAGDRGWAQGTLVTLAIGLHNVPEGLAVATVMAAKGTPPSRILLWTALTSLPQALVAPPAYVFVDTFKALLPLAMGFAAGCMIWIVLAELLPDAFEAVDAEQVATYATGSAAWLQGLSVFIGHLETPSGTLASPFGHYEDVLPLGLAPVLIHLLPAVIAPGLVAGLLAKCSWPKPSLIGASVGLLASHATACWLQLLLGSSQRLLCAALLPLIGAGSAALLWGRVNKGWVTQLKGTNGKGKDAADCSATVGQVADSKHEMQQLQGSAAAVHVQNSFSTAVVTSAQTGYSVPHHRHSHASEPSGLEPDNHLMFGRYNSSNNVWQQQQLHPASPAPYGSTTALDSGSPTTQPADQVGNGHGAWETHSNSSTGSCSSTTLGGVQSQQQQQGGLKDHYPRPCTLSKGSPLPLPGKGDLDFMLPTTRQFSGSHLAWGWGQGSSSSGSRAVVAISLLALGGAALSGVPHGLQLAGALAAAPDHMGHVLLPLLLLGAIVSCACAALLMPLLGPRTHLIGTASAVICSLPVLVAVLLLLCKPVWVQRGAASIAADNVQGLAIGFMLFVLMRLVLPMGRQWGISKCASGFAGGVVVGGVLSGVVLLLCIVSPYCLRV